MIYRMKIRQKPLDLIKEGIKTIEMRTSSPTRKMLKKGDLITFVNIDHRDKLTYTVRVVSVQAFISFKELYATVPLLKCGYTEETIADANYMDMMQYYDEEEIEKNGVLAIEIERIL